VICFEKAVLRGEIAVLLVDNGNDVNFWKRFFVLFLFLFCCCVCGVRNVCTCENDHQHE
jgi:hypothetical protein